MSKSGKIVYTCGVDWQHEICEAPDLEGKMPFFSSVEKLKAKRSCWKSCGIVKLRIKLEEWVEPQNLRLKDEAK
jgi:hypothetical protein